MAEEKKPKIDLKARLGKAGGAPPPGAAPGGVPGPTPAPGAVAAVPAPMPGPSNPLGGGLPVPPGTPVGPPPAFGGGVANLDPSNPLAAAVAPARSMPPRAAPPPPQPQRIEVDEMAVQEARKGGMKQGVIAGLVAAVVLGAVGFIAGGAQETSKGRARAVNDAKSLSADVTKSKAQLEDMAKKLEAGRDSLLKERKFPDTLARDLNGINVDFDGGKLAGVRFSGFSQDTTSGLIEYITAVQGLNDRKTTLASLLTRLQKPISEQLASGGKTSIGHVVLLGMKDPANNKFALLAPLTKPIDVPNPTQISLPAEFTAVDPTTRQNVTAPKYVSGPLDKPAAVYVLPKSIEAACPSEQSGAIAQLGSQLARILSEIRGEKAAAGADIVTEEKIGLIDRAEKLVGALNKVQ